MKVVFIGLILVRIVACKDNFTINFIKSFIRGEGKPTLLVYDGLCWKKDYEVKLQNAVSKYGIRCASSLKTIPSYQDHNLLFLVDLECPEYNNILLYATSQKLFKFPFRWLVLSSDDVNAVETLLWSRPLFADSDVVLADNVGGIFQLTEIHRFSLNTSILSTHRGYFDGKLVDTRPHKELYRRRRNLMGHPLTFAMVLQDSNESRVHILKEDRLKLHDDGAPKLGWIAANHAFEMLNATRRYLFNYSWGNKINGKWYGMIGDLQSQIADIGTECILLIERLEVVTFTDVVSPLRMRFIFRQPPLTSVSNVFSLPFSASVWIAMVVCVAASTVTLYLTSKWEASLETSATQLDGSVGDALLLSMSAVAQQGCYIEPRRAPGRIMEWVLFTALMALFAAYSANIVVLLQAPSNSIRTLADLADSKITLAALDVDYSRYILKDALDPAHIKVNKRIMPENEKPLFFSNHDGVERIRQGMFAMHAVVEPIYRRIEETFLETEKCDLTEVDYINGFDAYTPVKKDSPYLEMIRVVYVRVSVTYKQMREAGILSALVRRYLVPKPRCSNGVAAFSSVGIMDLLPVLILMIYGVGLSVIILFAEIIYSRVSEKCEQNKAKYDKRTEK